MKVTEYYTRVTCWSIAHEYVGRIYEIILRRNILDVGPNVYKHERFELSKTRRSLRRHAYEKNEG